MSDLEDYDDDCEICRAQRLADSEGRNLSMEEFKYAAQRQKASGVGKVYIVGEDEEML